MRLAPAAQNKSPPNESTVVCEPDEWILSLPVMHDSGKRGKGAPLSRGPRLFARNMRRFVGPPS